MTNNYKLKIIKVINVDEKSWRHFFDILLFHIEWYINGKESS